MALNSPLIMKFHSSLFRIKPKPLVAQPFNISYSILKPYKTTHFMQSINAKTSSQKPVFRNLRSTAVVIVFAASMIGKFRNLASRAENHPILTEEITSRDETKISVSDAIETLKQLIDQKYEAGDYEECLKIFSVLDEVLSKNPIEPHALFENAVWMGFQGKEEEAIKGLDKALRIAKEKNNGTDIRDARLVLNYDAINFNEILISFC